MTKRNFLKIGDTFQSREGDFCKVVSDNGWDNVVIRFDSGYEQRATRRQLQTGSVKDRFKKTYFGVGYLGGVKHKTKGKSIKAYSVWKLMLDRCYGGDGRFPAYEGCTVCSEWHNFQNFADWYYENKPKDGASYDIDKDLLVDGNRVYSPRTCVFLTHQENCEVSFAKTYKMRSPDGRVVEIYNMVEFCRKNMLSHGNMFSVMSGKRSHHKGWTAL
jgi:hypothetical protein